jgi:hypothetical protein
MKKQIIVLTFLISIIFLAGCGVYKFNTGDVGEAKTIQVDFFPNQASLVEPNLSSKFTQDLQDLFLQQTSLSLVPSGGDIRFEGEITGYRVNPMSATSQQTAAQNRLTITINVRYYNKFKEEDDFEKSFSFYSDFAANSQLTGGVLESALDEILSRVTQDIFNASIGKW